MLSGVLSILKENPMETKLKKIAKTYIPLHILLLFYSITGICSKSAGLSDFLSFRFFLFYAIEIIVLFIYAVAWQQIIKKIPLTTAFCNKSIGILWGMLWGALIFKEQIKLSMIIGGIIVIIGVVLVVTADE